MLTPDREYALCEYAFTREGVLTETASYLIPDRIEVNSHRLESGYRWAHLPNNPHGIVALGSAWGFDPIHRKVVALTPDESTQYMSLRHLDVPCFYEESDFSFSPYVISHKWSFGYVCACDGVPVWSFRTQGYLYIDMKLYGDTLVFGTAGAGGTVETFPLPGCVDASYPLWADGETLLCISFGMKGERYTTVYLNAVSIP